MQIYLLRHAIAEVAQSGHSDADRALTADGKEKLRRVLRRAGAAGVRPSSIASSPLRRALETAAEAAEVLDYKGKVVEWRALLPEVSPYDLWEEIRRHADEPAILLAGHEPQMSAMTAFLLGTPALQVDMKKAALVRIDCDRLTREPKGVLKWMLTPAVCD
jgi:phosphohistidine phosphatase